MKTIVMTSLDALQFPLAVDVKVKFTNPAKSSPALGVYVAVNAVLFGLYVPAPPVQIPEVVGPEIVPVSTDAGLFLHEEILSPAFEVGGVV